VLVRQKGFNFRPGTNAYAGKDWTIHAAIAGKVDFRKAKVLKFSGKRELATYVSVVAA
jgi:ribosomal protein L27